MRWPLGLFVRGVGTCCLVGKEGPERQVTGAAHMACRGKQSRIDAHVHVRTLELRRVVRVFTSSGC